MEPSDLTMKYISTLIPCLLFACAAQGGSDGGGTNLPERGIENYQILSEPTWVLHDPEASLGGPSALLYSADGGAQISLFAHHQRPNEAPTLVRADAPATTLAFEAPQALGLFGTNPAIAFEAQYLLAYENTEGGLSFASSEDGWNFASMAHEGLPDTARSPSLVIREGQVHLYFSDGQILWHSVAPLEPPLRFGLSEPALEAAVDCQNAQGAPVTCWDADALLDPEVRLATDATGQEIFRLFYIGLRGLSRQVGFAASYDSHPFVRYGANPNTLPANRVRSPSAVALGDAYLIFWAENRDAPEFGGIRAAIKPSPNPTEHW